MPKPSQAPSVIYKKGQIVEVKGDQIAGGAQFALYWFRGKVKAVNGRGAKTRYDVKIEDPTRFNKKTLTVKGLPPRYVRVDAPKKKGIQKGKKKKKQEDDGGGGGKAAYGVAGEGGVCESWAQTCAREAKEAVLEKGGTEEEAQAAYDQALEENSPGGKKKAAEEAPPEPEEPKLSEEQLKRYKKGEDIRRKVEIQEGEGWKLIDRYTLEFGDKTFKAKQKVKWKGEEWDLKRIRMLKGNPVLMIDKDGKGIRRVECKECEPIAPPEPEPEPEKKEEEEKAPDEGKADGTREMWPKDGDAKEGEEDAADGEKKPAAGPEDEKPDDELTLDDKPADADADAEKKPADGDGAEKKAPEVNLVLPPPSEPAAPAPAAADGESKGDDDLKPDDEKPSAEAAADGEKLSID